MKSLQFILFALLMSVEVSISTNNTNRPIPMQMRMRMKDCRSTSDFIHTMMEDRPAQGVVLQPMERQIYRSDGNTQQGFNAAAVEIMASMVTAADMCEPRPTTVAIPPHSDVGVMYWPTCVKVDRCGGCCGTDLLECAANETAPITVTVMKSRVSDIDPEFVAFMGNVDITLIKHISCKCQCRTKPTDCNPAIQDYDEHSCSCRCRNSPESTSCPSSKRWDEKYCRCVCPVLINCLDDEYFDFNTCRCIQRTSVVTGGASPLILPDNPCATQNCRSGYRAVRVENSCQCTRNKRSVAYLSLPST